MPGTTEVLQEYLVKLGYATDTVSLKKFEDGLGKTGKRVLGVGTAVASVVVGLEAAAARFAYSMRKMYFESELSNASVKNLNALSYAGKQIGITGDAMTGAIKGMAQAMRLNPGLQGLVESFGVKVEGRDTSDVMLDFVQALKGMPEFTATKYASMFGIDPDTYHLMIGHLDELKAKKEEQLAMNAKYGLDLDKQKATILEYTSTLDKLGERFGILQGVVLTNGVGPFKELARWVDASLEGMTRLATTGILTKQSKYDPNHKLDIKPIGNLPPGLSQPTPTGSPKERFEELSNKYGYDPKLQDAIWALESARGKNSGTSSAGAKGPFQFMPATAKQYGAKDDTFEGQVEANAKMLGYLTKKYKGDTKSILAAYNWGEGNVDRKGLGNLPPETKNYVDKGIDVMFGSKPSTGKAAIQDTMATRLGRGQGSDVAINQTTQINVSGPNAPDTAKEVAKQQSRVNGDLVRNLQGAVR